MGRYKEKKREKMFQCQVGLTIQNGNILMFQKFLAKQLLQMCLVLYRKAKTNKMKKLYKILQNLNFHYPMWIQLEKYIQMGTNKNCTATVVSKITFAILRK